MGLAQGMPLRLVPDEFAPHPRLSAPVLRVTPRERDVLRWLFPDRIPTWTLEAYQRLCAEAEFLARPAQPFALDPDTHTASVPVEQDGRGTPRTSAC